MAKKKHIDYAQTQPYRLGQMYKELGERLMDERTDLRDLVAIADYLGCKIGIEIVGADEPTTDTEQAT